MKQARNIKVGDVVQFPHHCFDERRQGWNGWIFRAAIVERLYTSKNGEKCAEIRYCSRCAGRYQLLPNVEAVRCVKVKFLFEYNVEFHRNRYIEFKGYEDAGEPVCWTEDAALLVNHGIF